MAGSSEDQIAEAGASARDRGPAFQHMYDLSLFRQNLDAIAKRLADRGFTLDVETFRRLDAERRAELTEAEQLKAQQKAQVWAIAF